MTTAGGRPPESGARAPRSATVRTKVLATVIVMTTLAMLVSGAASYVIQERRLEARVDAALVQELAEFRQLATEGVDPATGERFSGVRELLTTALSRNVADEHETFLGLVDGEPELVPLGRRPFDLDAEPEAVAYLATLPPGSPEVIQDVETSVGTVRLAAVQVSVDGRPPIGTYVVGYGVDLERRELAASTRTYALVALAALLLVAVVAWAVTGRLLRPLTLLRAASHRITETDLSERIPVRGNDDVSDLTRTFNAMLDRLEAAFSAQRDFIDDAGHELRTPVTIVRGHLELLDPADLVEVAETRALVLDEVDRMGRLVEDLILLAKARRPDFVQPGPVELGGLTDDVLEKARALGDRAWSVDARAEVVLRADAQRLTQALLQLADNAVKYTNAGDRVAIGSEVVGDEARLWVRDTGPGIDAADAERVFERFGRAAAGRGVEGSGLGLAIVTAIAEGHGGRVDLFSRPGAGCTFTLVLPGSVLPVDTDQEMTRETPDGTAGSRPGRRDRAPARSDDTQEVP